jgi:hypothetical protein
MKYLRQVAMAALLALAVPTQAQWVPGVGDDFVGTSLDTNFWTFRIDCFGCLGYPGNTENASFYNVSGGNLNLLSLETSNSFYGQWVYQQNVANVKVSTLPAPGATWFVETSMRASQSFHDATNYPFVGLAFMRDSNHGVMHVYKQLDPVGNNNGGVSSIIFLDNGTYRDDFGQGNGYHGDNPATDDGAASDVLTFRVEKLANGNITFAFGRNIAPVVSDTYTPAETGGRKRLYDTLNNIQDLRIGVITAPQGTTTTGMSASYDYLHTNLPVSTSTIRTLYGNVPLEEANFPEGRATTVTFQFFDAATNALLFTRNATVGTNQGTQKGFFSIPDLPLGNYNVCVKGNRWLAVSFPLNATSTGDITLAAGTIPVLKSGDANNDNSIDVLDLDRLIQAFDAVPGMPNYNEQADFNADNSVDVLDLDILIRNFDQVGDDCGN